jgi:hypothetical protein
MIRTAPIAGIAVMLVAICAAREAGAGLMESATISPVCHGGSSELASAGDPTITGATMTGAAESTADRPTERQSAERKSSDDADLKLLATQPAQGGAGATGSATSVAGGSAPAAMISFAGSPTRPEPTGVCVEFENSDLPAPPASDLLRPPKRDV